MNKTLYLRCFLWVASLLAANATLYGQEVKNYPSRVGYPTYWGQRYTQFAALGTESTDIVMIGDDFMDRGIWNEFFDNHNIKNRGIAGDVISAMDYRLDDVIKGRPSHVFIYIGKRDIKLGVSPSAAAHSVMDAVKRIHDKSRRTRVYVISILPEVNTSDDMLSKYTAFNEELKNAAQANDFTYIDIVPHLCDESRRLDAQYTYNTGTTLNGRGYYAVSKALEPYICKSKMVADDLKEDYNLRGFIKERNSIIEYLPTRSDDILMIGNSITNIGEWSEFIPYAHMRNRGISSDMTSGVLERLPHLLEVSPRAVFLMIGINDLGAGKDKDYVVSNILKIVSEIKRLSHRTAIYVESILPVNPTFTVFKTHTDQSESVRYVNSLLEKEASRAGYVFINLHHRMCDRDGYLSAKYTNDGLHLCWEGYRLWRDILTSYIPRQ